MSRLASQRQKSKMATRKNRFLTNNPIIKCDMCFLTNLGVWNLFLYLKLQLNVSATSKHQKKVNTWSPAVIVKYNFY